MPYKDPERAREAKRLSAAKRRAALSDRDRAAVKQADSKRKRTSRPAAVIPSTRSVADPEQEASRGALVDVAHYNAGNANGGTPRIERITSYRRIRPRYGPDGPGERLPIPGAQNRHKQARQRLDGWMKSTATNRLSDAERAWALYALLKDQGWIVWVPNDLLDRAVKAGRVIAATCYNLPPKARQVATAIRRGLETEPQSRSQLESRTGLIGRDLDVALDQLAGVGVLDKHREPWMVEQIAGYSIRTDAGVYGQLGEEL